MHDVSVLVFTVLQAAPRLPPNTWPDLKSLNPCRPSLTASFSSRFPNSPPDTASTGLNTSPPTSHPPLSSTVHEGYISLSLSVSQKCCLDFILSFSPFLMIYFTLPSCPSPSIAFTPLPHLHPQASNALFISFLHRLSFPNTFLPCLYTFHTFHTLFPSSLLSSFSFQHSYFFLLLNSLSYPPSLENN